MRSRIDWILVQDYGLPLRAAVTCSANQRTPMQMLHTSRITPAQSLALGGAHANRSMLYV